jgi:hypothetical protein
MAATLGELPNNDTKTTAPPKLTFKDMVMGNHTSISQHTTTDLLKDKLARIFLQDGNHLKLVVHVSDEIFNEMCAPWKDTLVIKLLGKNLGFVTLRERLQSLWKLSSPFEIIDVGHGFFMVNFAEACDRAKVMEGGPWMIFYHYQAVQTWTPEFAAPTTRVDKTLVWIRFPTLSPVFIMKNF